jgi:hypothetical protein
MSKYRQLQQGYEYQIGKIFINIRNKSIGYKQLLKKEEFGAPVGDKKYIVTPGMIWDFISIGKIKDYSNYFPHCDHNKPKRLRASPFMKEIHNKLVFGFYCEDCTHESEMAI